MGGGQVDNLQPTEEVIVVALIAIDGGGTNLRAQVLDSTGLALRTVVVPTDCDNYEGSMRQLISAIYDLVPLKSMLDGIGISIAGNVKDGQIIACGNLTGWIGKPLAADLESTFRRPILLFNDGQAMAASEYVEQRRPLILGIQGSGVNFCYAFDAGILRVPYETPNIVGEGGHATVERSGRRCGCGERGCLEAYIGGTSIARHHGTPAERMNDPYYLSHVMPWVALGLGNLIKNTGGRLPIYLTGGVACGKSHLLPRLNKMIGEQVDHIVPTWQHVEIATHGTDAGLHGAGILLQQALAS